MKKIKVAVIGCGSISKMHLESIVTLEGVRLIAVCDVKRERALQKAEQYQARAYFDYCEMFEKEVLDAVHICLPHHLHTVVAKEAFRRGIHVLSEKPMSIHYEDALATVEEAEMSALQYGVIFQCRYATTSQAIKQKIQDGTLGKVISARAVLTWNREDDYYANSDWKGTWDKEGGGVIINQAIHSLDLANWFIDNTPVKLQSSLHNYRHKSVEVEDTAEGFIQYENGASLLFYATNNYSMNEPVDIRLICEKGTVRLSISDADITYQDGRVEHLENHPQRIVSHPDGKEYWGKQHAIQIYQFYQAVLGLEPLEMSGREALKIQKIVCDIYKNAMNGE